MGKIIDIFKYFSDKKFSTIAGTLVYFLLMSIAPFILWLTLVGGNIDVEKIFSNELFVAVSPILRSLKSSAESAASGAGIVLLVTTLYSSTNFFYHLRRSGEIIYDSRSIKSGVRLRIASVFLIFAVIIVMAIIAAIVVGGSPLLERYLPYWLSDFIVIFLSCLAAFALAIMLNIFACPYKIKASETVPGSLLTTALWLIFIIGFNIYSTFANPERLYGKIAAFIIFLLWCYVMMSGFVIGIIYNGMFKTRREYKKLF